MIFKGKLINNCFILRNVSEMKTHLEEDDGIKKRKQRTLNKPLHRQERERVESSFAYQESKQVECFKVNFG